MAKEKTESPTVKKPKTSMASKEKPKKLKNPKTTTHPPYFQMIKEALMNLKEKNGSSPYAIAKQIEEKYKPVLPENFRKTLSLQLKNSVAKGKLVKIRASYKLSETTTRTTRQQQQKKKMETRSKKAASKPEMVTKKKRRAKKPRQVKSIKSPGSKKVLRASAS